ncbi:hypothetical protein ACIBO6_31865 [Streptomyces luteogriseus]|uniref:hypothetical protein n=1 Tax=Streptomyces luteogriseus TaxID=68233 RepID=UPI0037A13D50
MSCTVALSWEAGGLLAVVAGIVLLGLHPAMPHGAPGRARVAAPAVSPASP